MEKIINNSPQEEIAKKIIHLHDSSHLGFRRISKQLLSEGIHLNKDAINKVYNSYITKNTQKMEPKKSIIDELAHLKLTEQKQLQILQAKKEIIEVKNRLALIYLEKKTLTYSERQIIFDDPDKMFNLCQKIMPVIDPVTWADFNKFCLDEAHDPLNMLSIALGSQEDYEQYSQQYYSSKQRFDLYIKQKIKERLNEWKEEKNSYNNYEQNEQQHQADDEEEDQFITIDLPQPTI